MHDRATGTGRGTLRALIGAAIGAAALSLAPPAAAASQGLIVTSFDSIRLEAPVTLILKTGAGPSGRAEGDRATLDRLKVQVSGRLLTVTLDRPRPGETTGGPATLYLTTGDLRRVLLSGGGTIRIDRMKGLRGEIVSGGSGDISVGDIALDRVTLLLAGNGRVTLGGRTGVADVRVLGPGTLAAEKLRAREARISSEGAGSISMTAEVSAKLMASGSGDVTILGSPACTVERRGTGVLRCGSRSY